MTCWFGSGDDEEMGMRWPVLLVVFLAVARSAWPLSDRTIELEVNEQLFGITPAAGAVGDGRLTAHVSLEGTVMCLRWPNATYYEHADYRGGVFDRDPAMDAWHRPHYGAAANAGFFAGIVYEQGASTVVRWFRDGTARFSYAAPDSNRLNATYSFPDGLVVTESTFVVPDAGEDLAASTLVRTWRIGALPTGAEAPRIVMFGNPSLRTSVGSAYNPMPQVEEDDQRRFATFALTARNSIVTALPDVIGSDARTAAEAMVGAQDAVAVAQQVEAWAARWGPGVYMRQGASVPWSAVQVGGDAARGHAVPPDAYDDAADGSLEGSLVAAGWETTAMFLPTTVTQPVAWYASFSSDVVELIARPAWTAPDHTRSALAVAALEGAVDRWWANWLNSARLPSDPAARAFAQRALISLRTGFDPASGAIVASTSCQPPYNLDWPRDGSFFQWALEVNGKYEEAEKHARFYLDKNATERLYGPLGSWAMNTYADGTPGGPIDFEIDQVGLALWALRTRTAFAAATDPVAAAVFAADAWPTVERAADLLVDCVNTDVPGLQCPANEDDHPEMTATLHGAIAVWLGLRSAADMATATGFTAAARRYMARADELGAVLRERFAPVGGADPDGIQSGALGWSVWPAAFWTAADADQITEIRKRFRKDLDRNILVDAEGTSYDTKMTIALLAPPVRDASTLAYVDRIHAVYLGEIVSATGHLGEVTVHDDFDGDGSREWRNITALPHIWAQTLLYLSLLAAEDPTVLDAPELPNLADNATVSRSTAPEPAGCGCRASALPPGGGWSILLVLLIVAAWIRSRRPRAVSGSTPGDQAADAQ